MMLLRAKFVALMGLSFLVLLSGCGKSDSQMEKDIQGWWMATEMVPQGGSRFKPSTADETLIVGFNETFQFYVIDGSHRDCGGEKHAYRVKEGKVEVDSTSKCEAKSAVIHEVKNSVLTLRDARLANSTVFSELVLVKISYEDVKKLHSRYELNVALAELEEVTSRPSSAPAASKTKVTTPAPAKTKVEDAPPALEEPRPVPKKLSEAEQEQHDASKLTSTDLEGIWVMRGLRYKGVKYVPGDTFKTASGTSIVLNVPRYAFQMKDGRMTNYGEQNAYLKDFPYDYKKNQVVLVSGGREKLLFPIRAIDLKKGEMRIGDSQATSGYISFDQLGDGAIFERITVEQGRKLFHDNAVFSELNPQ